MTESDNFGWLKDISTKDLINRKFFHTMCNDLVMARVCEEEIDRRAWAKLHAIRLSTNENYRQNMAGL